MVQENKKIEEDKHTRVLVRIGELHVELEGTYGNVQSLMGKPLYDFIKKLQTEVGEVPVTRIAGAEIETATEYPPPLGKPASLGEALRVLMVDSGWGRGKPRTLSEIITALETSGIYYKKAAVATTLVTLVKNGVLRRIGSRGSYQYVAA
jgi:hypothetical protein